MTPPPDSPLSAETIRAHLKTRQLGATLSVHEEVDSTNRLLADLARAGAAHGTVVVAESQTAGRGRLGRPWASPRGLNLYASILLTQAHASPALTWIPLLAAVATVRAIRAVTTLPVKVKWPNDVLVSRDGDERKLAGILVEALGSGQAGARAVVIGIGLNVNMPLKAFSEDLRSSATSLSVEAGHPFARAPLLAALLEELERLHDQLCNHGAADLADAYAALCVTLGKHVRIELVGSGRMEGTAEGLAPDGALRLRTGEGKILEIRAGDVVHLR
ncbi:MAG: biotin--[acetyl-CoA-carboxylase] ligase [Nitrospirae bacterium]|nr:MAG: biotin--[acetyl-CoA-carboxylase] ligase [Nitrospirota bacterium]